MDLIHVISCLRPTRKKVPPHNKQNIFEVI